MRRGLVLAVGAVVVAGAVALAAPRVAPWWRERALQTPRPHPDVILITLDTTRADRLGCYGGDPAVSPALDALARRGVLFRRAYSHVPTTLPSHASLLTGVTPARHGVHENGTFVLDAARPTLGEAFLRAGYRTGAFVSSVVLDRRFGLARGFGDYVDELETDESELVTAQVTAEVTAERALSFLAQDDARPVFAWVHFYDPHDPYAPPEPYASRFAGRAYDGEIASMDAQIGRLLEAVAKRGRPTIVAAVADHGESLGEHQEPTHAFFVYGATQHVPLIVSYPGVLPSGREVQPLVRVVDVLPTLLAAAQLPVPEDLDGQSLLPLVTGRSDREAGPAYQESYGPRLWWGAQEILGVRTGPWLYVRAPRPELYNVEDDPAETVNLAAERPAELERLQDLLRGMIPEGDPLAHRASVDPETARKLRALGYLGGSAADAPLRTGTLADPKDVAPILQEIAEAQGFLDHRDYERALAAFQALVPKMPRSTMIRGRVAKVLLALKRYDEAYATYRELRDLQPDEEGHWVGMARARFHQGRPEDALTIVREGIRKAPESTSLHENAGILLEALKRLPEAEDAYRRAAELGPREPGPQLALASIADKQGRTEDAARLFVKVVELSPHSRQGRQAGRRLGAIAETLARDRRLPEAGSAYRAAVRSGEAGPAVYLNAALVVFQLGARDEALGLLQEGAGRFPKSADLQYRLGRLLGDRGARVEAELALTRALEIDPARQDARAALARLRGQASR